MSNKACSPTGEVRLHLFDPRRGDLPLRLEEIRSDHQFAQPQRFNYFTVLWLRSGSGRFHADLAEYPFESPVLLFFNPYQTFFLTAHAPVQGASLQFHANFFCIETHHEAVGCNGVLFNDLYGQPLVVPRGSEVAEVEDLLEQMDREFRTSSLAHGEVLASYLKVFLIKATRLKVAQQQLAGSTVPGAMPEVILRLTQQIEKDYRTKHTPAAYAAALHLTPKALGRLVRMHLGKTLTELIRDRLLKHAKWQLLHTRRTVKEIAWEVGFRDEYYFSRVFKRATGCSPTSFREFETAIRGGSNLSI